MPSPNSAAWIPAPGAHLEVKDAPYPTLQSQDVVIQTKAVAVNPMDYKIQDHNPPRFGIRYPTILGSDGAGVVVETGAGVTRFATGDRVMVHCFGTVTKQPGRSGFQKYVLVNELQLVGIPPDVSFAEAAVLPLSCETAMAGLYVDEFLGLQHPGSAVQATGKTLLVWGGSSRVGCSVIQMANASGYKVAVVAGKRNHALCAALGASAVFDHAEADVVRTTVAALQGHELVGAYDCIGDHNQSTEPCARILSQLQGSKTLVSVLEPPSTGLPESVRALRVLIPKLVGTEIPQVVRAWMTEALRTKQLLPKPDPLVVGEGLESVQAAIDTLRKGVSGAKVVVTL